MDSKQRKYLIAGGAAAALLFTCCGGLSIVGLLQNRPADGKRAEDGAARAEVAEADGLWAAGKKGEAVDRYSAALKAGPDRIDDGKRPTVFQRVIEYHLEQGKTGEAKAAAEQAADLGLALAFDRDDARRFYERVQAGREARKTAAGRPAPEFPKAGPAAPGEKLTDENYDRIKPGMTEAEVKAVLGPKPANVYRSSTDPKTVGMTWVSGGRSVAVNFEDGKVLGKTKLGF